MWTIKFLFSRFLLPSGCIVQRVTSSTYSNVLEEVLVVILRKEGVFFWGFVLSHCLQHGSHRPCIFFWCILLQTQKNSRWVNSFLPKTSFVSVGDRNWNVIFYQLKVPQCVRGGSQSSYFRCYVLLLIEKKVLKSFSVCQRKWLLFVIHDVEPHLFFVPNLMSLTAFGAVHRVFHFLFCSKLWRKVRNLK